MKEVAFVVLWIFLSIMLTLGVLAKRKSEVPTLGLLLACTTLILVEGRLPDDAGVKQVVGVFADVAGLGAGLNIVWQMYASEREQTKHG